MQLELKRLQLESGITFIIVTHDQEEALVMSDRMAVLDGGKVCQCGSPSELYENPNSRFVANFIGVSNLFEGVRSGERSVRVNGQELVVETDVPLVPGQSVALVVRPERLQVLTEEAALAPTRSAARSSKSLPNSTPMCMCRRASATRP
jgi:spermidine/putrescine transport system ATP-binding protein/putrescine transport system ATP-binding protein